MARQLTIVHANELVEASYSLNLSELRLIALASASVDSRAENIGELSISVQDYIEAYNVKSKNVYAELKDAVKSIMRKPIIIKDDSGNVKEISWLLSNQYNVQENSSSISMQFSPLIEPYLFELKERFTVINFQYAARLNTPFSFRLYQWLLRAKNMRKSAEGGTVCVELTVEWMKDAAQISNSYSEWRDFNKRVLTPAIDKINTVTDIYVNCEPVKKGRSVHAVKFNYVLEKLGLEKPARPRLARRPKVTKGSHEEGMWMRKNMKILSDYEVALKQYDSQEQLTLPDLKKLAEYSSICDSYLHNRCLKEIKQRKDNPVRSRKQKFKADPLVVDELGYDFDNE
ncbi:RepB family plasmid replication initiator protein [Photobacterium phosphoreum]|uniref:replication initiation protein n=1 Tax=Photobacterium phosphoreum TaxID=659 RepID=UPI001E5BA0DC|nr:replication initiation protein [Photobacterium phosphoreum]MCD9504791.1 RepB family plasmid replication initiator protein [Photobacterium phosphoreum]